VLLWNGECFICPCHFSTCGWSSLWMLHCSIHRQLQRNLAMASYSLIHVTVSVLCICLYIFAFIIILCQRLFSHSDDDYACICIQLVHVLHVHSLRLAHPVIVLHSSSTSIQILSFICICHVICPSMLHLFGTHAYLYIEQH